MAFTNDQFRLDGKVAIVTGAGGRGNSIGRAYAVGLANAGASVIVADLNEDGAKAVADEINASGGKAIAVQVDITDKEKVAAMVKAAEDAFGGLDILVNNAALMVEVVATKTIDHSPEQWERIFKVNVNGALYCTQAAVPAMRKRGGGRIVNQLSAGAWPPGGAYGITKLALHGLTINLSKELGPDNIRVNAIAPGMTKSDAGNSLTPEDSPLVKMLANVITLKDKARGEPDELVGALVFLCSDASSWITGQAINVDGGWTSRT